MNNKLLAVIIVAVVVIAGVGVYLITDDNKDSGKLNTAGEEVTDAMGRKVIVPDTLDNGIVTIGGVGPLRFLSLFDVSEKVIEVDKGDVTDNKNGRAYSYAYDYDSITSYHADNALDTATVESIANKNPSLVVIQESVWTSYTENCQTLALKCTVIVIKAQALNTMWDENYGLSQDMENTINLLGTMLGKEDRAKEVISGMESILSDLRSLKGNSDESVYVAGVTIQGSNTLNTTFPSYMPFTLIGADNAYNGGSTANKVVLNIEDFSGMDVDMIVIDPSSADKIAESDSQLVLQYFYKLNNDSDITNNVSLYVTVPIVWDGINYDCSLASAYYLTYLLYGTLTYDQMLEKIDSVFETFYGEDGDNVLADMSEFFVEKSSANKVELPILSEVKITYSDGVYSIAASS